MWLLILSTFLISCGAEKIAIIGAGPAGIAMASKLLAENITDFRLFEAENRIGGRVNSVLFGDAYVDLGAEYIHGEEGNLVFEMAKNYVDKVEQIQYIRIFYGGQEKQGNNLIENFVKILKESEEIDEIISLGDAFLKSYNTSVLEKYKNDTEMSKYAKNFIHNAECFILSLEGAFGWFKPVANTDFQDCPGIQTISWDGKGYKKILDILLEKYPNANDKITLNKSVNKIKLEEKGVRINFEDGTEHFAEHVIFTPSLGVLKQQRKIFEPELDDAKTRTIENLGFDGVMKILFEFPQKWWKTNENFVFVWNETDKSDVINDIRYGPIMNDEHWLTWFYSLNSAPKNPRVMIGWIVGPMVAKIEQLDLDEITNGTFYVMKKFLGNDYNVTRPTKVIHSKWCTNPHFLGTYSYETVHGTRLNISRKTLSEPIYDATGKIRVQFAGEATNPTRYSTVDGAIGSGFREGERLAKILKNKN